MRRKALLPEKAKCTPKAHNPSAKRNMDAELMQLRNGEITPDEFVRRTKPHWDKLTCVTFAKWDLPPSMEADDVYQELILHALEEKPKSGQTLIQKWDPARSITIGRYVAFNAIADTNKELQRQRQKGHYPLAASSFEVDPLESSDDGATQEDLDERLSAHLFLDRALKMMNRRQRLAVKILLKTEGNIKKGVRIIDRSVELSIALNIGSAAEAMELLGGVIEMIKSRSVSTRCEGGIDDGK